MTRLEMQFMEQVPVLLRSIHKELKRLNDNLEKAAGAEPAQKKEDAKEGWPYRKSADTPLSEIFRTEDQIYSRRILPAFKENNINTLGELRTFMEEHRIFLLHGIGKNTAKTIQATLNALRKTPLPE